MAQSILFLITRAPYGVEEAFAGLRMALAFSVNGAKTSVVMMDDGVHNAVAAQRADAIKMPSNMDATKELYDFDAKVYVVKEDLASRGIDESRIFEGLQLVSAKELPGLLAEHDVVTTF